MVDVAQGRTGETRGTGRGAELEFSRRVVIGGVLGFLVVATVIGVACHLLGLEAGAAVGVGVFVGLFGGVGFGAMVGGSL